MIAAGLGCRAVCSAEDVARAIAAALAATVWSIDDVQALYSVDFKREQACLRRAADKLSKPLFWLSLGQLQGYSGQVFSSSVHVMTRFGLPSIAETAALAGATQLAGAGAPVRLLAPRHVAGGATCALASAEAAR